MINEFVKAIQSAINKMAKELRLELQREFIPGEWQLIMSQDLYDRFLTECRDIVERNVETNELTFCDIIVKKNKFFGGTNTIYLLPTKKFF